MSSNRCFLCTKRCKTNEKKFEAISDCKVSSSQKSVQIVLQHLANCIKTRIELQPTDCICPNCYNELSNYDNLMVNLLSFQKKLTQQLNIALTTKTENTADDENEIETLDISIEEEHLADAFNPELDVQEEFISIVEDDRIIDTDSLMEDNDSTNCQSTDDESQDEIQNRRRAGQECVICGTLLKSKVQLQQHIESVHNTSRFACDICGVVRRDEEYLELHMNVHEGKTENECRYCDKRYSRPVNTLRHMRKHWDKKKYQCEKCGERFSLDNMLYNHRMLHEAEENPLICSICNQPFKSRKTYNHHMTIHQENRPRHQCTLCSKSFTERYTLKMHMKTHGVELSPLPRTRMNHTQLKERDQQETEAAVTSLAQGTSKDATCVICNTQFENKDMLDRHLQVSHDVILK